MSEEGQDKQCTKCRQEYPATTEFWYRKNGGKYGLDSTCKKCRSFYFTQRYALNKDNVRERDAKRYRANRDAILARAKERRADGRRLAYEREWAEAHREDTRRNARAYYWRNRERLIEKAREKNRQSREYRRSWGQTNKEKVLAYSRNRRAREYRAAGSHGPEDVAQQYGRQGGKCYYCGEGVGEQYHVDHIVPLLLGGSNGPENIVIACPWCNRSKGARHPMEFCGRLL